MVYIAPDKLDILRQNGHISDDAYNTLLTSNDGEVDPSPPGPLSTDMFAADPNVYKTPEQTQTENLSREEAAKKAAFDYKLKLSNQDLKKQGVFEKDAKDGLGLTDAEDEVTDKTPLNIDLAKPAVSTPGTGVPSSTFDNSGYEMQKSGIKADADAVGQKGTALEDVYKDSQKEMADLEAQRQMDEASRQMRIEDSLKNLDNLTNEVSSMKVDPNHFWSSASTENKMMLGVSLFLGSLGAANTGDNKAVAIIDNAIKKDIEAQKANMIMAREGVNQKVNVFSQMKSAFKDDRMAEQAAKVAALERLKMNIAQTSAKYANPEVQAKAQYLMGSVINDQNKAKNEFTNAAKIAAQGGAKTFSEQMAQKKDIGERTIPGLGMVSDGRESTKIREMKSNTDTLRQDVNSLVEIAKGGRSWVPWSERSSDAQALSTKIFFKLKELENLGVPQAFDIEMVRKLIPEDVTAIFKANASHNIEKARDLIENDWENYTKARGLNDPSIEEARRSRKKLKKGE